MDTYDYRFDLWLAQIAAVDANAAAFLLGRHELFWSDFFITRVHTPVSIIGWFWWGVGPYDAYPWGSIVDQIHERGGYAEEVTMQHDKITAKVAAVDAKAAFWLLACGG